MKELYDTDQTSKFQLDPNKDHNGQMKELYDINGKFNFTKLALTRKIRNRPTSNVPCLARELDPKNFFVIGDNFYRLNLN